LTRHELKEQLQHDAFTDSVEKVVSYTTSHRTRVIQIVAGAVIALLLIGAFVWIYSYRRSVRERDLAAALSVVSAPIGPNAQTGRTFPSEDARRTAALKSLSDVVAQYGGSREGLIAQYYRGTLKAQQADARGAETDLKTVADSGSETAPLAKIALAQLYSGQNRTADAENLLKSIINKPTSLVSKAQAEVLLAQLDQTANPAEAKRVLQTLKSTSNNDPAVSRAVDQLSTPAAR
jgi:hypothetical protein